MRKCDKCAKKEEEEKLWDEVLPDFDKLADEVDRRFGDPNMFALKYWGLMLGLIGLWSIIEWIMRD